MRLRLNVMRSIVMVTSVGFAACAADHEEGDVTEAASAQRSADPTFDNPAGYLQWATLKARANIVFGPQSAEVELPPLDDVTCSVQLKTRSEAETWIDPRDPVKIASINAEQLERKEYIGGGASITHTWFRLRLDVLKATTDFALSLDENGRAIPEGHFLTCRYVSDRRLREVPRSGQIRKVLGQAYEVWVSQR
jgi:hypothetical protein